MSEYGNSGDPAQLAILILPEGRGVNSRNPTAEIRKKSEGRRPNLRRFPLGAGFGFRVSVLFRISALGFRVSHEELPK